MALEPITRQEQIIAGKNLEPITRMERFLEEYGGGTGVSAQTDWNQTDETAADFIKNKPFGDLPIGGDTLTWDGNTEGLACVDDVLYKVSDAVVTQSDVANGVSFVIDDEISELDAETAQSFFSEDGFCFAELFMVVPYANYDMDGFVFPEAGIYFMKGEYFISSLTIPGYTGFTTKTVKRMDEKYMPILTSPGGKKFKLTVADDGTLSATEVT